MNIGQIEKIQNWKYVKWTGKNWNEGQKLGIGQNRKSDKNKEIENQTENEMKEKLRTW